MSTSELVSAVAAVVSAVGGAFAAVAAFRSADSARKAQRSADDAERRATLRQLILTAKDVELQAIRCAEVVTLTVRSYKDLATFTGNVGASRHQLIRDALVAKAKRAEEIRTEGKLFGERPTPLESAPPSELDRVLTKLLALLSETSASREDLERERAEIERQCDAYRKVVIERRASS